MLSVTLIGAGNVGYHLSQVLHSKGFKVRQVFSREMAHAVEAAQVVNATAVDTWKGIDTLSDIYFICLTDIGLKAASEQLRLPGKIVAHTSGALHYIEIQSISDHCGVLYPLQTFSKFKSPHWSEIPLLIESADESTAHQLKGMAEKISQTVIETDWKQRKQIHLAAVFANNFANHLWTIADKISNESSLSFELLKPLITETVNKALISNPEDAQTGPALRHDMYTLELHRKVLETLYPHHPNWTTIYNTITESIQNP